MLLAVGIYGLVVESIANLASLRGRAKSIMILVLVILPAIVAIVLLSGVAGRFVLEYRWIAFSLFIGLTLGGVPVLMRSIGRFTLGACLGLLGGLLAMVLLVLSEGSIRASAGETGTLGLFGSGAAAGAAMLLPGLSGSYVLLILGQYVVVLSAIDEARAAFGVRAWSELLETGWTILPVALGVLVGIGLVGVIVRWLLENLKKVTLGVLLGLLVGAIFGLWPFRSPVPPPVGEVFRGVLVDSREQAEATKPKYWPTEPFSPSVAQFSGAGALVLVGASISGAIGLLGGRRDDRSSSAGRS